jgi:hypothetical protein
MHATSAASAGGRSTPLSAHHLAVLAAGFGLGCASMILASRGAAASGSPAAIVIPTSMTGVLVAMTAGLGLQRSGRPQRRRLGWAIGATLALFGVVLGWIGWGMSGILPAWPLTIAVAALVALPALIAAARLWRNADV